PRDRGGSARESGRAMTPTHTRHTNTDSRHRARLAIASVAMAGAAIFAGCSAQTDPNTAAPLTTATSTSIASTVAPATTAPATTPPTTITPPTTTSGVIGASITSDDTFCGTFAKLAEKRAGQTDFVRNTDEAAWDQNIATVEHIAE